MDITTVFGTVIGGSNPSEDTVVAKPDRVSPECYCELKTKPSF